MKLHSQCRCRGINGCHTEIPDKLLNEEYAQRNHGQSIKRLSERGGITLEEALAIIQKRQFYQIEPPEKAVVIYSHILTGFKAALN